MFKINRKIEYALMALKHMNDKKSCELTTAREISEFYGAPFDVISRVLQILAQKNVLSVVHGAHGGYHVQKNLGEVTFFELCEWILGEVPLANCLSDKKHECDLVNDCNIVSPILTLNEKLRELYKTLSVLELIESRHQHENSIRDQFTVMEV